MPKIIADTTHPDYKVAREGLGNAKFNGLYYYAKTIEQYIIPRVQTERPWNTLGLASTGGCDGMIMFCHNNIQPKKYLWARRFDDVIFVTSCEEMVPKLEQYGRVIYLPLSIDTKSVRKHRVKRKTQKACYIGNPWGFKRPDIEKYVPPEVHRFGTMPQEKLLDIVAQYKVAYAIGLCAVEARALGCKIKVCDSRYTDPDRQFPLLDCKDAAKILQKELDKIDKVA